MRVAVDDVYLYFDVEGCGLVAQEDMMVQRPTLVAFDAGYVVAARSKWGLFLADKYPQTAATFRAEAESLGFDTLEIDKMWSELSQIAVIAGCPPDLLTGQQYVTSRDAFADALMAWRGCRPKALATPLFGLDAVMFQRGQAPAPALRKPWQARAHPASPAGRRRTQSQLARKKVFDGLIERPDATGT